MSSGPHALYLVRHAIAEDRGPEWPDDALRPLTDAGIARFDRAARGLAAMKADITVILSSPFLRARQTADILARRLPGRPPVVDVPALQPEKSWRQVLPVLVDYVGHEALALVGHEPSIGQLAAALLRMRGEIEFKKGGACRIDVETLPPVSPGRLRWLAPPRVLMRQA